jgi:hypothetical protein
MVRLAISVEGLTEERFVQQILKPYLEALNIYAFPFQLGRQGGHVCISRIRRDLNNLASSFDKVTTLYDFYGFRDKLDDESKESLEQKILQSVAAPLQARVIPYVQMYEFEGILFSSPEAMENNICEEGLADWAESILQQFDNNPEKINNSKETAPSRRLKARTTYIKTTHGPNIAKEIGLTVLREKCAGFGQWLEALESLR